MEKKFEAGGIICEFNPLHLGHKYIIDQMKENGAVVCVMSGNFVQRGETAIIDKYARTEMALKCGADIIIELPVRFSTAGANLFALGAVSLINSLGFVDKLYFGCENENVELLKQIVELINSKEFNTRIRDELKKGISYAVARERCIEELLKDGYNGELKGSNNNLAIEYINAIQSLNSPLKAVAVKRLGSAHDSLNVDNYPSAMAIRTREYNKEEINKFLAPECADVIDKYREKGFFPADYKKLETAILAKLRLGELKDFSCLPDISEGIENKLFKAVKTAVSLDELYTTVKSKRFTHARIRRMVLHSFLGINKSDILPQYIKILGISKTGEQLLSLKKNTLPIIGKVADTKKLSKIALADFKLECKADDIFALCTPKIGVCGQTYKNSVKKI